MFGIFSQSTPCESSRDTDTNWEACWSYPEDRNVISPVGLEMDSDSDHEGETSVRSSQTCSYRNRGKPPLRRSFSSSALDELPQHRTQRVTMYSSRPTLASHRSSWVQNKTEPQGVTGSLLGTTRYIENSNASNEDETSLPPYPLKRTISLVSDERINVVPCESSTPDRCTSGSQTSPLSTEFSNHSRCWSFSPLTKIRNDPVTKKGQGATFSKIVDFGAFKKLQPMSMSTPSDRQSVETDSIGVITDHSTEARDDQPTRYEFEAPRKGQLGLVIESDALSGPVVYAVKDYSPLLGLVRQGDKIVQIDGKNTTRCTLSDMYRLLSTKPGLRHGSHPNLKIVVLRRHSHESSHSRSVSPLHAHSRASSYGSTSSFASMSYFGIASSFDENDSNQSTQRPMRNVRFSDDPLQGMTLTQHKVRGSF